jgi:hypothetical protein
MSGIQKAKLGFEMRMPPRNAERIIRSVGIRLAVGGEYTERLHACVQDVFHEVPAVFLPAAFVSPRRMVLPTVVVMNDEGIWLVQALAFDFLGGSSWENLVRLDVRPFVSGYSTVGFVLYEGEVPIDERLATGLELDRDELAGGHFYAPSADEFFRVAVEEFEDQGVPGSAHRVPSTV